MHRNGNSLIFTIAATVAIAACGNSSNSSSATADTVPPTRLVESVTTTTVAPSMPTTAAASQVSSLAEAIAGHRLAFQNGGTVRTMLPDGSDDQPASSGAPEGQEGPDWSPDGRRLAFHTQFATVWVADVGGPATELFRCTAPCHAVQDPSWSPDGTEVAFMMAESTDGTTTSRAAVVAVNVNNGSVRTLYEDTSGVVWLFGPRWSPDGRSIVFEESTYVSNLLSEESRISDRLVTAPVGGSGPAMFIADTAESPDWSAADVIVFTREGNLFLVNADGSAEHQLTAYDGVNEHAIQPTFLPGGEGIVFTYVTGQFEVNDAPTAAVIGIDGTGFAIIGGGRITHPRLQP